MIFMKKMNQLNCCNEKKYYAKEEIEQLTEMFKKQDDFNEVVK